METYWWFIYLAAATALTLLFQFAPSVRQTVVFLGTALIGVAAIIQLQSQAFLTSQEIRHGKVSVAFNYIDIWNTEPMNERVRVAAVVVDDSIIGKSPQQVQAFLDNNDAQRGALIAAFNLFENMGLAIRTGYADDETLCQYFSEPALRYFSRLKPWLYNYRSVTQRHGSYEHYEWLYDNWLEGCPTSRLTALN